MKNVHRTSETPSKDHRQLADFPLSAQRAHRPEEQLGRREMVAGVLLGALVFLTSGDSDFLDQIDLVVDCGCAMH